MRAPRAGRCSLVPEAATLAASIGISNGTSARSQRLEAFAGGIGRFVSARPTVKMLALAFLFVIGVVLIADGFDHHVPKGYVYFAMAFSVCVEMLNQRLRKRPGRPVDLRHRYARRDE